MENTGDEWAAVGRVLGEKGLRLYPNSVRQVGQVTIAFAKRGSDGFVVSRVALPMTGPASPIEVDGLYLYPLDWHNYLAMKDLLSLAPTPCNKRASFGTGDRLGMVSAAHVQAFAGYEVFPVLAQQSPRELVRTGRDFRDVLLSAICGILETGYTGRFGADADHIKHEQQLRQAIAAGFSMYTLDLSDHLRDVTRLSQAQAAVNAQALSPVSKRIVRDNANMHIQTADGERYVMDAQRLVESAITFEGALQRACAFYAILDEELSAFDLEISIDESARVSTPEDHLYVVEYLRRNGVELHSLALRFPGEFQKGVDYVGDLEELGRAFRLHASLCRQLGGYRLSLHSGSDKFSVYPLLREATDGHLHVKTSGTSWLKAIELIARADIVLFTELYRLCLVHLQESREAYRVSIRPEQFPPMPPADVNAFLNQPHVRQLFHISYGALLDEAGGSIYEMLYAREKEHYHLVAEHIRRHLQALCE